jgi:alkylation response protein AidB-like acyl-CoA dehydrogenase
MANPKPQTNQPLPSVMEPQKKETFGNLAPWSEPSWYSSLASPYYNDSHKRLRDAVRTYIDANIKPYMLEWEEAGEAPTQERHKWAQTGFAFADVPEPYRPRHVPGPAGIPVGDLDLFHLLIMSDENSRIEGGVGIALGGGSVIGVPPIVHHGTEEQKKMWLPGLFTWETSFCLGITEPSGGVRKNTIWSYPQGHGELKDNNANWNV